MDYWGGSQQQATLHTQRYRWIDRSVHLSELMMRLNLRFCDAGNRKTLRNPDSFPADRPDAVV